MENTKEKKSKQISTPSVSFMIESIVGCKWSLSVLEVITNDIRRPGEIQRAIPGISAKVLNERLQKLVNFSVVEKTIYPVRSLLHT